MRALLNHAELLATQIAELTLGQQEINARLNHGAGRMTKLETGVAENTVITTEVRDLLTALKGGLRLAGWLGSAAKWLGGLAVAGAGLYTAFYMLMHGGQPPGK